MTEKERSTKVASRVQSRRRLGSRAVLLGGFGALLILMAIICIDSLHTLGEFQTANTQIRQDFQYREHTLEQVRAGLYESGNIVRDYILMESDPDAQAMLRTEFQTIQNETTATLNACIQSLPAGKREPLQHLAVELGNYWSTIGPISALGAKEKKELGNSVLRGDVLSQHAKILAITKEVRAVNNDDKRVANDELPTLQWKASRSTWHVSRAIVT